MLAIIWNFESLRSKSVTRQVTLNSTKLLKNDKISKIEKFECDILRKNV